MNNFQEELVIENDRLVHYFVRKLKLNDMRNYEYDDLLQIGRIGLIKAAKTYNGTTKFSTYAARCINNEVLRYFRDNNKHLNISSLYEPFSSECDGNVLILEDVVEDDKADFEDSISNYSELEKIFNLVLNSFSVRESLILIYTVIGKNQFDIAKEFGISQSYISRLREKIKNKIKTRVDRVSNYEIKYSISVNSSGCVIEFCIVDEKKATDLILEILKINQEDAQFNITRSGSKIHICFSSIEVALPVIAKIIDFVDKSSIELSEFKK